MLKNNSTVKIISLILAICLWAFVIGEEQPLERCSDDGEPSGTAGRPILGVLQKQDRKNVLVAVVRYFGGIKLGAGGLVRAYAKVTANLLKE